ncbi:gtpase activating protein [Lichtheimia corymbifera JMRC:FSU:9682]|uniref:Gtpase activating protein n=1 Tax=Lichtheimia corymbifera JMRC:FSU:9682 TaxID=1263082 RepID=A0A068RV01_9FUNG|nr:gtpase activating protein [Lichtheimia corymbifera JMRC:FSU:9682]
MSTYLGTLPVLTCQTTNSSSDTNFTELTTGTSIKTHNNGSFVVVDQQNDLANERQPPPTLSTTENKAAEIRGHYESNPPDVAAEMEKWFEAADRYGFLDDDKLFTPDVHQAEKEAERATKWAGMAKHAQLCGEDLHTFIVNSKFIKRVYKGIPDCWRRDAWYFTLTNGLQKANNDDALREQYKVLLSEPSSHVRQIDLDIPRTMHGHIMFRQRYGQGQRALFNVLRAFSGFDKEVGYCQGMTNIAAMLLMYCEEERAYTALVHMFLRDGLHDLFVPGFPALMESFFIQERLVERYLARLYRHLHSIDVTSAAYATRWYITMFTGGVVKYQTLLRIWDAYFLEGFNVFYFVAIALLKTFQYQLLSRSFESCMTLLSSTLTVPDDDKFMKLVKNPQILIGEQ